MFLLKVGFNSFIIIINFLKYHFRSFSICSDMPKFHEEICKIKVIFIKNGCSERFIDKCVQTFLNKVFIPKRIVQTAEKKQVTIVLPFMGMISTEMKVKLHRTFKQLLLACELRVILKISSHMKIYFNFKDKIKRELRSLLVFNFKCNSCNGKYIGKITNIVESEPGKILAFHPSLGEMCQK